MNRLYYLLSLLILFLGFNGIVQAQNYCVTGCNDNTFLNSHDPNTIEYDSMVSLYHSTIMMEVDGTVKVWGALAAATSGDTHLLEPTVVEPNTNAAKNFNYTGDILKIAAGGNGWRDKQFAILTTDGLYVWGKRNTLLPTSYRNSDSFGKVVTNQSGGNNYGLPADVNPTQVKMMFGSYKTLGIVTCDGRAYVLSGAGKKDGTNGNSGAWQQVLKGNNDPLLDVVALRGTSAGMIALTSTGELYTWGIHTYLGNASSRNTRRYATQMTLPKVGGVAIRAKVIGMSLYKNSTGTSESNWYNSYYVLSTKGELFSLGYNNYGQLGDFSTTESTSWVRVQRDNSGNPLPSIAWFSPNEHDARGYAAVNALTLDGKLWSWGANDGQMLGGGNATKLDPTEMGRGLSANERLTAVETGGHTTMVVKQCSQNYGYIGHRIEGSMGDGSSVTGHESVFNFSDTADVNLCGAPTAPALENIPVCFSDSEINLNLAHLSTVPQGMELKWYKNADRTEPISDPESIMVSIGDEFYAFYEPTDNSACEDPPASDVLIIVQGDTELCEPDLSFVKEATLTKTMPNTAIKAELDDSITYTFTVKNTGAMKLVDVVIEDPLDGLSAITYTWPNTIGVLLPEETATATATYTVTQADVDAGEIENQATVSVDLPSEVIGFPPMPNTPSGTPTEPGKPGESGTPTIVETEQDPSISLTKVFVEGTHSKLNDIITYTLVATNTGNVTLTDVVVTDTNADAGSIAPTSVATLEVGGTATFSATHTITQADLDQGWVANLAEVTGDDPNEDPVTTPSIDPDPDPEIPIDPACPNCTITPIVKTPLEANDDAYTVNGKEGTPNAGNVLEGDGEDNYNGNPATLEEVSITVVTPAEPVPGAVNTNVPVLDPVTGIVSVPENTPAGTYEIEYEICEKLNTNNCATATVSVTVEEAPILAVDDSFAPFNGYNGGTTTDTVLDNDTLNGIAVIPSEVTLTPENAIDWNDNPVFGIRINPDGTVTVDPSTRSGVYTIPYQICEILNPDNCNTAMVTVVVERSLLITNPHIYQRMRK